MKISSTPHWEGRKKADLLVLPFFQDKKGAVAAFAKDPFAKAVAPSLQSGDFKGKKEETHLIHLNGKVESRLLLLGLGKKEEVTVEGLRRAFASALKVAQKLRLQKLSLALPLHLPLKEEELFTGIIEGMMLSNYLAPDYKNKLESSERQLLVEELQLVGANKEHKALVDEKLAIFQALAFTRDLVNRNADEVTPQYLEKAARGLKKKFPHLKLTTLSKKEIEKEGLHLLLAVNQGSDKDPAFIVAEYSKAPRSKQRLVVIGKGVTYDSGGLNLKPTGGMETMRYDMAGAGAALGLLYAVCEAALPCNVTIVIPSTENSIDAKSYKPGDVYQSHSGKSVEIGNTDAEGRLILADALSYTLKHLKPTHLVDLATLTGAVRIALGSEAIGALSNNDELCRAVEEAGKKTFERVWRLPLIEEYKEQLKSDIADIKNCSTKGEAGTIIAGIFLEEFVGKTPWVHLDIASTAFTPEGKRYYPKYATGVGVRLLFELIKNNFI